MAVYAAHLTRTLHGSPSVFQVAAHEALGSTVKPALEKLIDYLAEVYPKKCGWFPRWYDELYFLFDCCLQYHYLKHYAASFSETFYGLIRVPIHKSSEFNTGQQLPHYLEKASLILLVLVPYLRDKVERIIERWREDDEDGRLGQSGWERVRRATVRVYSIVHLSIELVKFAQFASYLCGRAESPTPALALLRLTLTHAPPMHQEHYTWTDMFRALCTGRIGKAVITFPMIGGGLLRLVEYLAFGMQFIRWWESDAPSRLEVLPQPPPPAKDEMATRYMNRCPLCLQRWRTPTALPVSGYVFCYTCISRHVRARRTCPVTSLPVTEQDLIRLYIDH